MRKMKIATLTAALGLAAMLTKKPHRPGNRS